MRRTATGLLVAWPFSFFQAAAYPESIMLASTAVAVYLALRRRHVPAGAALVAQLPDRYRIPVVLRHVDGLSYDEMAAALGRPEGTLKAQVHRGLALLRSAAQAAAELDREVLTA